MFVSNNKHYYKLAVLTHRQRERERERDIVLQYRSVLSVKSIYVLNSVVTYKCKLKQSPCNIQVVMITEIEKCDTYE